MSADVLDELRHGGRRRSESFCNGGVRQLSSLPRGRALEAHVPLCVDDDRTAVQAVCGAGVLQRGEGFQLLLAGIAGVAPVLGLGLCLWRRTPSCTRQGGGGGGARNSLYQATAQAHMKWGWAGAYGGAKGSHSPLSSSGFPPARLCRHTSQAQCRSATSSFTVSTPAVRVKKWSAFERLGQRPRHAW